MKNIISQMPPANLAVHSAVEIVRAQKPVMDVPVYCVMNIKVVDIRPSAAPDIPALFHIAPVLISSFIAVFDSWYIDWHKDRKFFVPLQSLDNIVVR